jgi:phosphotransferase system  glucose/maltose/N-acetylglucosamine-specific IIC component
MLRRLSSYVFLIVGILIGLGAFGHGSAVKNVHAAIDRFPIDPNVSTMLYVVWYFVSGCMLLFGVTIVWSWFRSRAGDTGSLRVPILIGALYVAVGVGGMIYRHGDPFMATFIVLGGLLLASTLALRSGVPSSSIRGAAGTEAIVPGGRAS